MTVTFTSAGSATTSKKMEHASITVHEPPKPGGLQQPGTKLSEIKFQFNPKELTLAKNAKWQRQTQPNAAKSGVPEFKGAEPAKLQLEIFLDSTDTMGDATIKLVEELFNLTVPTKDSRTNGKGSPPWVIFKWGTTTGFPSFVSSVSAKYTLFTPGGMPVRAVCTVSLEEVSGEPGGQNPTSGAKEARGAHVLTAGDSLQSLAYRAYGNPELWRHIAEANGIDDPMRLRLGSTLLVPALEEIDG
ncbi:peptidase M23 [Lentzea guizhouensis]|uniref:Peptidase M23 n=1 Tax=Lentzea guizhouensis TaxID=1586287 RepID=A0A1B2HMD1_9PSEU|nr:LysM peptidoglycan-binding domain-containing protein [Lentzea guizhouensis]ANZ38865.1 peptidase M23 [Lentzea guizhouensis]